MVCYEGREKTKKLMAEVAGFRSLVKEQAAKPGSTAATLAPLEQQVSAFEGTAGRRSGGGGADISFGSIQSSFAGLFSILHETDMPPTTQTIAAVAQTSAQLKELQDKWEKLKKEVHSKNITKE